MDTPTVPTSIEEPPPFQPVQSRRQQSAPIPIHRPESAAAVPHLTPDHIPRWTHHGFEDDECHPDCQHDHSQDPPHPPPLEPVPLVLNHSRLGLKPGEQTMQAMRMIGSADRATIEARLKQREFEEDARDSLDVPDDELFVTRPGWVEEQDRRYVANSQRSGARWLPLRLHVRVT